MSDTASSKTATPDAVRADWVARAPSAWQPYLRLMRADRPIGFWLLMWPCWWSTALAAPMDGWRQLKILALFTVGAIVMRGAGCVWNDILDRKLDAKVARTAGRPLAAGELSVAQAAAFMAALALVGFAILLSFNSFAIWLGVASLLPVAIYPLAKRVTHWPQAVLGLTFNWGALMGWAAVHGELALAPLVLYAACLFWTLGYDTIYAHMDKADDAIVGIKSSALRLGAKTRPALAVFYAFFFCGLVAAGWLAGLAWPYFVLLAAVAVHPVLQVRRLDIEDPVRCLSLFRSNARIGWMLFLALAAGGLTGTSP